MQVGVEEQLHLQPGGRMQLGELAPRNHTYAPVAGVDCSDSR